MIRIEDCTYWLYSVDLIKEKASAKMKYLLRAMKGDSELNTDLLIKEIDKDIVSDILERFVFELFNFSLKRYADGLTGCVVVAPLLPEDEEHIQLKTNIFLVDVVSKIEYADVRMQNAIIEGLCYEWSKENMYEPGIEKFGSDYKVSQGYLLSAVLQLKTRERNTNPIY